MLESGLAWSQNFKKMQASRYLSIAEKYGNLTQSRFRYSRTGLPRTTTLQILVTQWYEFSSQNRVSLHIWTLKSIQNCTKTQFWLEYTYHHMTKICTVAEKHANKKSKQKIDVNVIGVFKIPKEVL